MMAVAGVILRGVGGNNKKPYCISINVCIFHGLPHGLCYKVAVVSSIPQMGSVLCFQPIFPENFWASNSIPVNFINS